MSEDLWVESFINTVEAYPSKNTLKILNGKIILDDTPTSRHAEQNLQLVCDILRSDIALPQCLKNWLANLFDRDGQSRFYIKQLTRRKGRGPFSLLARGNAKGGKVS